MCTELLFQLPPGVDPRGPEEKGAWVDTCKKRFAAFKWLRLNSARYTRRIRR